MSTWPNIKKNNWWRNGRPIPPYNEQSTPQIEVSNWETGNNTQWPLTVTTWKSPSPKTAKALRVLEFYKKPAKKPLFVHHQSAIPKKSKINFIHSERKRIEDRCSTQRTTTKHQNMFDDILRLNGYPENSIEQTKHRQSQRAMVIPQDSIYLWST